MIPFANAGSDDPSSREEWAKGSVEAVVVLAFVVLAMGLSWYGFREIVGASYALVWIVALLATALPAVVALPSRHDPDPVRPAVRKPPMAAGEWIGHMRNPAMARIRRPEWEAMLLEEMVTREDRHSGPMPEFGALVFALNVKAATGSDEPLREFAGIAREKVSPGDFVDRWGVYYPDVAKARTGREGTDVEAVVAYARACAALGHPLPTTHLRHLAGWAPNVWWAILSLDFQDAMIPQGIRNLVAAEIAIRGEDHGDALKRSLVARLQEATAS